MMAGSPEFSHPLSMTKWAAFWAVNPSFLVRLAITLPLILSTHNSMESYISPCHSTRGYEKMSSATLDMKCVGTGVGTLWFAN